MTSSPFPLFDAQLNLEWYKSSVGNIVHSLNQIKYYNLNHIIWASITYPSLFNSSRSREYIKMPKIDRIRGYL